jgi:hypothetical protein
MGELRDGEGRGGKDEREKGEAVREEGKQEREEKDNRHDLSSYHRLHLKRIESSDFENRDFD